MRRSKRKRKHSSIINTPAGAYPQRSNHGTRDTDEGSDEESDSEFYDQDRDSEYEVEKILSTRINHVGFVFLKVNTRLIINQSDCRTTRMGSQMDGVC